MLHQVHNSIPFVQLCIVPVIVGAINFKLYYTFVIAHHLRTIKTLISGAFEIFNQVIHGGDTTSII